MKRRIKNILFVFIIVVLTLPLLQFYTNLVVVKKLHGWYKDHKMPEFTIESWFDNSFQTKYETYFNQKLGFRADFVRLHNQIDYSLFKELHANSVIIGKEEYLYEKNYIKSYQGEDYIGQEKVNSTIKTIDSIYQVLKEHQTEMLIVLAPGKGYFYPEFIPDELKKDRGPTNYEAYINALSQSEIPYIDFNDLFLKMKDTSSIVLYPKTGIHWSQGIMPFVMDSTINKIESILNKDLPNIIWSYNKPVKHADKQDADVEKGLNLFLPLDIPPMTYPNSHFEHGKHFTKPRVVSISDSFYWQMFNKGINNNAFSNSQFWFYYKQVYGTEKKNITTDDIHVRKELFESDLVLLVTTDANLYKFPFGFLKSLEFTEFDQKEKENEIKKLVKLIKSDEQWFNDIKTKAKNKGIPIDSMLFLDAKYVIEKKHN